MTQGVELEIDDWWLLHVYYTDIFTHIYNIERVCVCVSSLGYLVCVESGTDHLMDSRVSRSAGSTPSVYHVRRFVYSIQGVSVFWGNR